jgi:hypothetical protein
MLLYLIDSTPNHNNNSANPLSNASQDEKNKALYDAAEEEKLDNANTAIDAGADVNSTHGRVSE